MGMLEGVGLGWVGCLAEFWISSEWRELKYAWLQVSTMV